ncbi:MAG: endonuclease/exonuclease/phosphatase family protein [Salinibacter sp.]
MSRSSRCSVLTAALYLGILCAGGCGGMDGADAPARDASAQESAEAVGGYAAQRARIYLDGIETDWNDVAVRHSDVGDGGGLGLERLWVAHSGDRLFLRIELSRAINLQEDNAITLYLDTDNAPSTGTSALGLGAEASWTFGERSGRVGTAEVGHAALGLHTLPTVRSDVFEVALDRSARPGGSALFSGDSLRVALSSEGDRLPDADGGLGYVLSEGAVPVETPSVERPPASEVRILSQNSVNNFDEGISAIFQDRRQPSYRRIFDATAPDVIAFQEVYAQTADTTERVMEGALGIDGGWSWAKRGRDLVLGSRFPIEESHPIPGYQNYESGAFLLDARSALGRRLIVVVMHPPCCNDPADAEDPSRNAQRQQVVDGVAAFLRDVTTGEGPFGVSADTPIAVVGDMNFVGAAQQPRTLRTGEIVNTDRFGPAGAPDWDGTPLLDTRPRQTGAPLHTTWIDPTSSFPPGRLDYAYVTDSALDVVHEFVLNTAALAEEARAAHGLQAGDTSTASDHLPVVVDVATR